jgi:hypothetical protein
VRAPAVLASAVLLLFGASLAAAQPAIPPSAMPGRERERFTDSPVERFMKPGPQATPPAVDTARPARKPAKRRARPGAR